MSPLTINDLLERNKAVAAKHEPLPFIAELMAVKIEPTHLIVLTCADPRCNPQYYLGLEPTDEVIFFRNANGHVAPILNDILALDQFIGIHEIMIVHHTDCGALNWTDEKVRAGLKKQHPNDESIDSMVFGGVTNIEQSIKDDLAVLRDSPYIRKGLAERAVGFVYDIKTGLLKPVEG